MRKIAGNLWTAIPLPKLCPEQGQLLRRTGPGGRWPRGRPARRGSAANACSSPGNTAAAAPTARPPTAPRWPPAALQRPRPSLTPDPDPDPSGIRDNTGTGGPTSEPFRAIPSQCLLPFGGKAALKAQFICPSDQVRRVSTDQKAPKTGVSAPSYESKVKEISLRKGIKVSKYIPKQAVKEF